jgi:hypothetical protein
MGCGGVGTPILHGTSWEVPVLFGFAGTPNGSIHVDKASGFISYSYGGRVYPTLSPKQLTHALKRTAAPSCILISDD